MWHAIFLLSQNFTLTRKKWNWAAKIFHTPFIPGLTALMTWDWWITTRTHSFSRHLYTGSQKLVLSITRVTILIQYHRNKNYEAQYHQKISQSKSEYIVIHCNTMKSWNEVMSYRSTAENSQFITNNPNPVRSCIK